MICRTRKELIDTRPRRAFISYAHVEEPWRRRLVKALEPLKRDGFVETWHDGMLLPGERWHPKILSALADSELVFLLVSPALLESEYARETEIPLAVQRADMGRIRLVPVLLQSCEWTKEPFAKYQALPDDKLPIAERSDVDEALDDCLERLRTDLARRRRADELRTEGSGGLWRSARESMGMAAGGIATRLLGNRELA